MKKYKLQADGMYKTSVSTKKYDENGKLIIVRLSAKTQKELDEKVGEVRTKLKLGIYANDGKKTFGEYAEHWLKTYKENQSEAATNQKYRGIINNHLTDISRMRLSDLVKSDIQELINKQDGHPDTQRMIKLTVNQILESAIDDELLYKNVCKKIRIRQQQPGKQKRILTDKEKEVISELKKNNVFTETEQLYIDTLFCTGVRPEEALALTYSDIKASKLSVNKALTWKGGKNIKPPKSKAGYRTLGVPQWYQSEVDAYRETHHTLYIFTGDDGNLISQSTYKRFWNGIYNKINVKMGGTPKILYQNKVKDKGISATDLTPYVFRHNYCTMLYYLHVDIKEASRIMGHSNIRITLEIYTHLDSLKSSTEEKIANIAL